MSDWRDRVLCASAVLIAAPMAVIFGIFGWKFVSEALPNLWAIDPETAILAGAVGLITLGMLAAIIAMPPMSIRPPPCPDPPPEVIRK